MAGVKRVLEPIYTDAEHGITVTLDHEVPVTRDPQAIRATALSQRRHQLAATLNRTLAEVDELTASLSPTTHPADSEATTALVPVSPLRTVARVALVVQPVATSSDARTDLTTFFTLLTGLIGDDPTQSVACEVVAAASLISFRIVVPAALTSIVEQQLYAAYPTAHIRHDDGTVTAEPTAGSAGAVVDFAPATERLRPFRTDEADPLHALLETLGALGPAETVQLQLLVSPKEPTTPLVVRAALGLVTLLRERLSPSTDSQPDNDTADETIARLTIRVYTTAASDERARALLSAAIAPLHQWNNPGGAQLHRSIARHPDRIRQAMVAGRADSRVSFAVTAAELASLYHLPATPGQFARLATLAAVQLPPPAFPAGQTGLLIGQTQFRQTSTPVVIAPADRLRHLYLIGQTGTGKSSLFQSLFLEDVERGEGGCFIDPHGEAIEWLLARIPANRLADVVLFDPSASDQRLGLNLLEWRTPEERDLLIQELILLFYKLFDPDRSGIIGPQFEHWLRNAALTVTEPTIRGTLADIPRLFTDDQYQAWAVGRVTHPAAKHFWHDQMAKTASFHRSEMLNYFTSKFGAFLGNETLRQILTQRRSAFDLRTMMDRRKILLVNLSKGTVGELNAQLLGTILLAKLQLAAFSRAAVPASERAPFYVYLDEFHTVATDSFASLLSEVRKYGVALHLTHQYVNQLSPTLRDAIVGNVGTTLAFRLGRDDASWLASHLQPLTADDLIHVPTYQLHCKTLHNGTVTTPFTVAALHASRPPVPAHAAIIRSRMRAASALLALSQLPKRLLAAPAAQH